MGSDSFAIFPLSKLILGFMIADVEIIATTPLLLNLVKTWHEKLLWIRQGVLSILIQTIRHGSSPV